MQGGFGRSVLIADANGDGFGDVIIGAPTTRIDGDIAAGTYHLFYGQSGFNNWLPIMNTDDAMSFVDNHSK